MKNVTKELLSALKTEEIEEVISYLNIKLHDAKVGNYKITKEQFLKHFELTEEQFEKINDIFLDISCCLNLGDFYITIDIPEENYTEPYLEKCYSEDANKYGGLNYLESYSDNLQEQFFETFEARCVYWGRVNTEEITTFLFDSKFLEEISDRLQITIEPNYDT